MDNQEEVKKKRPGILLRFLLILLVTILLAAVLLFLWAWVAFRMRYSADFIRAGLVGIYMLPCFVGGRLLRCLKRPEMPLFGALLGGCFYGVLVLCSLLVKGNQFSVEALEWETPLLCILTGAMGALRLRNGKNSRK